MLQKGFSCKLVNTAKCTKWAELNNFEAEQLEQTFRKSIPDYSSCSALVVATPYAALPKGDRQSYRIIRHHVSDVCVIRNYLVQNGRSYIMHLCTSAKLAKLTETLQGLEQLKVMDRLISTS